MNIKKIETQKAPKVIGPYSQGVIAGSFIYLSGQIAINPRTGKLVDGEIKEQTKQVIDNLTAVLSEKGSDLDKVVKVEVYLSDINDFKEMNEVYATKFRNEIKPARQVIQAAKLPLNAKIEISAIAYLG
jgi:2-iminobutanoate/2-iminopropanoate deaminase